MTVTTVYDNSEAVELSATHHLYLKPKAKLTINVILPEGEEPCWPVSNWELLEELKHAVDPDQFSSIKVSRSTKAFIRIEGETDTKHLTQIFLAKLNGQTLKLSSFNEPLSVEATEALNECPTKSEWLEAESATEVLPEHDPPPHCIHFEGLPCKWFSSLGLNIEKPCEDVLKSAFERYGGITYIDIPMLDPYREEVGGNFNPLNSGGLQTFDAFLQYEDHASFVNAMESLHGMKLMLKGEDGKAVACDIKATLDTTKHFSEDAVNRRNAERLKLQELEQQRKQEKEDEEAERKRKVEERKCREKKRRIKLKRKVQRQRECVEPDITEQDPCPERVEDTQEWDDRKLLLAQRRVESFKLLTVLLEKVNGLVQVDKISEELQLDCDLMEGSSETTFADLGKKTPVSLPILDGEGRSKDEIETDNKPSVTEAYVQPVSAPKQKKKGKRSLVHKDKSKSFACGTPQKEARNEQKEKRVQHCDRHIFKLSHSQDVLDSGCFKKLKIYETDDFIHYLLNYYHCPEYARLFLETNDNVSKPWCQRMVHCNGNSFQIKLRNMNGHFTEMKLMPKLDQELNNDSGRCKTTIKKLEKNLRNAPYARRFSKDCKKHLVPSEHTVPLTSTRTNFLEGPEHVFQRTWKGGEHPQNAESDNELKDVLEEISSTSEYFSEEPSGKAESRDNGDIRNIRKSTRKLGKNALGEMGKKISLSDKNMTCDHEDVLGHFLHSYSACSYFEKHSKCNLRPACHRPSFHLKDEGQTSESDSEVKRLALEKKSVPKKIHINYLADHKDCFNEKCMNALPFLRNPDLHKSVQHKSNVRANAHNETSKIIHKAASRAKQPKKSRRKSAEWEVGFPEDDSAGVVHTEQARAVRKTADWCNSNFDQQTGNHLVETPQLAICSKSSFNNYLDWERHFYRAGGFVKNV
ncbi:A-kinase anchor protein 17B-like [Ascaphus truei]|uniref:A-kinase anchor protein 17B-like n=1 Tax=Ascaphus truei TaxID=8439 RepID=UPI003F59A215